MVYLYIVLGVVALFGGTILLTARSMKKHKPAIDAAKARFQAEVGYPFGGSMSVLKGTSSKQTPRGVLTHRHDSRMEGSKQVTSQDWTLSLSAPPPAPLQLVERRRLGAGQTLRNLAGAGLHVDVSMPGPVEIGDPELNARFVLYTPAPQAALRLMRRPELKRELLACAEVLLTVTQEAARFSDPTDANFWAGYDAAGHSRFAVNPAPMIEAAIPTHQRIERILLGVTEPG